MSSEILRIAGVYRPRARILIVLVTLGVMLAVTVAEGRAGAARWIAFLAASLGGVCAALVLARLALRHPSLGPTEAMSGKWVLVMCGVIGSEPFWERPLGGLGGIVFVDFIGAFVITVAILFRNWQPPQAATHQTIKAK